MTRSHNGVWRYDYDALRMLFAERMYTVSFLILAAAISALYMFLLPSLPTGALTLYAIRFITPLQVAFALVFGFLLSLIILLNLRLFRVHASGSRRGLSLGSILASLVNGLCCTPIIPTLIALSGASTPVLFRYSPAVQAFFEFNYPYFYLLSSLLLLVSVHYLSRNVSACSIRK